PARPGRRPRRGGPRPGGPGRAAPPGGSRHAPAPRRGAPGPGRSGAAGPGPRPLRAAAAADRRPTRGRSRRARAGHARAGARRLVLARALYGRAPLLIVDRLEADLDAPGRAMLERVLGGWPGTVLLVGSEGLAARLGAREHRIPPRPRAGGSVPAAEDGDGDGE